jgi:hypothetical protein
MAGLDVAHSVGTPQMLPRADTSNPAIGPRLLAASDRLRLQSGKHLALH